LKGWAANLFGDQPVRAHLAARVDPHLHEHHSAGERGVELVSPGVRITVALHDRLERAERMHAIGKVAELGARDVALGRFVEGAERRVEIVRIDRARNLIGELLRRAGGVLIRTAGERTRKQRAGKRAASDDLPKV